MTTSLILSNKLNLSVLPEANLSFYVLMALALTFLFNIIVGISLCMSIVKILGIAV